MNPLSRKLFYIATLHLIGLAICVIAMPFLPESYPDDRPALSLIASVFIPVWILCQFVIWRRRTL